MKKAKILILFLFSFSFLLSQKVYDGYLDGQIYLKVKDNFAITLLPKREVDINSQLPFLNRFISEYEITEVQSSFYFSKREKMQRTFRLYFSNIRKVEKLIRELSDMYEVEYAEKVPYYQLDYIPNDLKPSIGTPNQWYLHKINAASAWELSQGGALTKVAVIDCGIQGNHPDLVGKIVAGWDIADNDNNFGIPNNNFSHGTHVAGLVGAKTDNGIGIASIGYNVGIMVIKATGDNDDPDMITHGYEGIEYAANSGAKVINMSWGSTDLPGQTAVDAINNAWNSGCILVASAGNDGNSDMTYPASLPNVLSVAATDDYDTKASFSSYGTWVDVSAPGIDIYSTYPTSSYTNMDGTSMAAPLVAGLCGLIASINTNITNIEIVNCIKSTTQNINSLNPSYVGQLGTGRINAYEAIKCMLPCSQNVLLPFALSYMVESSNTIQTTCTVLPNTILNLDAAQSITLQPGFWAKPNSNFHAYIDGCGGSNAPLVTDIEDENIGKGFNRDKYSFKIFPNPNNGNFTVEYELFEINNVNLLIMNTLGQVVSYIVQNEKQIEGKHKIEYTNPNIKQGLYFVILSTENQRITQKIVVNE